MADKKFTAYCLKGLFETDESVYEDRGYKMANFVTIIPSLAQNVLIMISTLGFQANSQTYQPKIGKLKYTIRISRKADEFTRMVNIQKN